MAYLEWIKQQTQGKKLCMYPMGLAAKAAFQKLWDYGIKADFFSDHNSNLWGSQIPVERQGTLKGKIECISKTRLSELDQDDLVVIVETLYYHEIKADLKACGVKNVLRIYPEKILVDKFLDTQGEALEERVNAVLEVCADQESRAVFQYIADSWRVWPLPDDYFHCVYKKGQYFDSDLIKLHENEVFVDAGAYTGDTVQQFLSFCGGKFERIHLFELDPAIFVKLEENVAQMKQKNIVCHPVGLSDENKKICFSPGDSNSRIGCNGCSDAVGTVGRLDDILGDERVTFIKMDIEGAEMSALVGAENIIRTQKPKLAICIYHSPDDMLNIPLYIKKLVPEYNIYIRHYTDMMLETVCYAICDDG